ncbi:MAG: TIR domain-containing protein [Sphingomonas sp.]|nr:TIR domain-containing protein [Sphingomonas sp.]
MNAPDELPSENEARASPVFVSYATADRKQALSVCKALERHGTECWISSRDVAPGENYQESIVRTLRGACAMVLVFSDAANKSDEVKKELSLASRYAVPVMALRIADVEPSDAFAYELSTRQWIDAFAGWDRSIELLERRIAELRDVKSITLSSPGATVPRRPLPVRRRGIIAVTAGMLLMVIAGAWLLLRPTAPAAHSMIVRVTTFQRLSEDLPATMPDTVRNEIIAAFNEAGDVGVSTAPVPPPGGAPDYALSGTIRRDGDEIRAISRLSNERSGVTLWSGSLAFDADQLSRVPRQIAVHAGNVIRCGLFGASTYAKSMPDPVLSNYLKFCHYYWFETDIGKMLYSARRVVASAPDFSWGWSAVTIAAGNALYENGPGPSREALRREGLEAAAKALALDPRNSEVLAARTRLMSPADFSGQEALLKRAIVARPLDCGCEHWQYALMLQNVGRDVDAAAEAGKAVDMLAFDRDSHLTMAKTLNVLGKREEAKQFFVSLIELDPDRDSAKSFLAVTEATETGDYAAGISALANPKNQAPAAQSAALAGAFRAIASGNAAAKSEAAKALLKLPDDQQDYVVVRTLAALGASREALQLFINGIDSRYDWPALLWYPSLRSVLNEPAFPALAERLGLMNYWRTTRHKPDVCAINDPPPFCRMI